MKVFSLVNTLQLAFTKVVKYFIHDQFGFSNHHGVGMRQRFLSQVTDVHAAHKHRNASGPKAIGDLITALHIGGHGRYADHIDFQIEIDGLYILVRENNFIFIFRNQRGNGEKPGNRRIQRLAEK